MPFEQIDRLQKVPNDYMPIFKFGTAWMLASLAVLGIVGFGMRNLGVNVNEPLPSSILVMLIVNVFAWMIFTTMIGPAWYSIRRYLMSLPAGPDIGFNTLPRQVVFPAGQLPEREPGSAWWTNRYGNRQSAELA